MTEGPAPAPTRKLTPAKGFASVFLAVFLVVFLAGAAITFTLPETYMSVARIRAATPAQLEAFSSRTNFEAAARQLGLNRTYALRYGEDQPFDMERTIKVLHRTVQVRRIRGTDLAEVRVYSLIPAEAAQIANAIVHAGISSAAVVAAAERGGPPAVIDLAVPALKPARPNKPLNLTLAALVGALLGVMAGGVGARLAVARGREMQSP